MPSGPRLTARLAVSEMSPAFADEYGSLPRAARALTELMLTMAGPLLLRLRWGIAARQQRTAPSRLNWVMASHTSSPVFSNAPCSVSPPATLTSTSIPPRAGDCSRERLFDRVLLSDVQLYGGVQPCAAARQLLSEMVSRLFVKVGNDQSCTFGREPLNARATYAVSTACHEDCRPVEASAGALHC